MLEILTLRVGLGLLCCTWTYNKVVDAKNLRFQLSERRNSSSFPEAFFQIAFADIVILNKVDLVSLEGSGGVLEELEKEIHNINSLASIIRSVRCQVDLPKILNCRAYEATHAAHLEELLEESRSLSTEDLHDSGVRTLCICEPRQVDLDKVRLWLEEILWDKKYGMDVYRCKGVLSVQNSDQLHTLQAVREIYEIVPARKWKGEENQMTKIVFIGHNLNEDVLNDSFRTYCMRIAYFNSLGVVWLEVMSLKSSDHGGFERELGGEASRTFITALTINILVYGFGRTFGRTFAVCCTILKLALLKLPHNRHLQPSVQKMRL
nr:cobw domain-containing protein 1 [Quercus suber]